MLAWLSHVQKSVTQLAALILQPAFASVFVRRTSSGMPQEFVFLKQRVPLTAPLAKPRVLACSHALNCVMLEPALILRTAFANVFAQLDKEEMQVGSALPHALALERTRYTLAVKRPARAVKPHPLNVPIFPLLLVCLVVTAGTTIAK